MFCEVINPKATHQLMLLVLLMPLGGSLDLLHIFSPAPGVGIPALGHGEWSICLSSALAAVFSRKRQMMSRDADGQWGPWRRGQVS